MTLRKKLLSLGLFLLWSVLGGVIVAAFFVAAFFGDFGILRVGDPGLVILFMPLFTAFILGLLLVDFELVQTVIAPLLATAAAIALVLGFMYSPDLSGVAVWPPRYLGPFSAVLLLPPSILGTASWCVLT